jgi:hypothetical protein
VDAKPDLTARGKPDHRPGDGWSFARLRERVNGDVRSVFGLRIPFALYNLKVQIEDAIPENSGWHGVVVGRNPWQVCRPAGRVLPSGQRTSDR